MAIRKLAVLALLLLIPAVVMLSVKRLRSAKEADELTVSESTALTNALRSLSVKQMIGVGYSDADSRAFVQTGFITNRNGHAERDGYVFELGASGWRLVARPRGSLNL